MTGGDVGFEGGGRAPEAPDARTTIGSPRPRLTVRQRAGARIAGAVSFTMIVVGLGMAVLTTVVAVFVFLVVTVVGGVSDAFGPRPAPGDGFAARWGELLASLLGPIGIVIVLLGIAVTVLGFVVSRRILTRHGVDRPRAVTWAATGVAAAIHLTLTIGVVAALSGIQSAVPPGGSSGFADAAPAVAIGVVLATAVLVGALSWWWMAHVLRAPSQPRTVGA